MVLMFPLPIQIGPYYTTDTIIELKAHWGYRNYRRYIWKNKEYHILVSVYMDTYSMSAAIKMNILYIAKISF
jgi:hypothetical protein